MPRKIMDAVEALMQFGSHTHPESHVSRKDLVPVFNAVAVALDDVKKRLEALEGK